MWYVLHVLTGNELEIAKAITREGFKTAVPIEKMMMRSHGKWREIEHILLPGYVFVNAEINDDAYYKLNNTPGVIKILSADNRPYPLPECETRWLHCLESCMQEPIAIRYLDNYAYAVASGFLKDNPACIERVDRHHRRVHIKLQLGGETKRLTLSFKPSMDNSDLPF